MILSIQSQVVYGCVGNQAATHIAHLLGKSISCIPTGLFSNHKGHSHYTSFPVDILHLVSGLRKNHIFPKSFNRVHIGYLGTVKIAQDVYDLIVEIKLNNPDCIVIIDPVLGDNNRLYVESDLIAFYKNKLCLLADILTPNDFEAELLGDMPSIPLRIITSKYSSDTELTLQAIINNTDSFAITFPKVPGWFCGTGDIFAAILTCKLENFKIEHVEDCCKYAINCLQKILKDNLESKDLMILKQHLE